MQHLIFSDIPSFEARSLVTTYPPSLLHLKGKMETGG